MCFRKSPVAKKLMVRTSGGEYQDVPSKVFFCITVLKNFIGEPFSVSIIPGIEKFYASEGYVTILCQFFLSLSAKKFGRGTLLCMFQEISGSRRLNG